jgi:hypothetical protein
LTKKNKPKPFSLLNRTRSIRSDKDGHSPNEVVPITITEPERAQTFGGGIKTAPLRPEYDRSFRDIMGSSARNRSVDRQPSGSRGAADREYKDNSKSQGTSFSGSFRETGGHNTFFSNLKSSSSKAVNLSKGLFGKVGRSYSTTEKEPVVDDEHYQLKVINLPLVEQTRLTRISKKLEDSRDKTEFWMPSFPWRAIDYLNYRGTETEGLYRVPGSGPQIKKWQRRFDEGWCFYISQRGETNGNQQNMILTFSSKRTFTISTSSVPCSRLGSVNCQMNSSLNLPRIALPASAPGLKKCLSS